MNTEAEKEIARFFQKRYRERLLYELSSKKRKDFFGKIAHTAEKYIDTRLIVEKSDRPIFREILADKLGGACYIIADRSDLDGETASVDTAISELWSCGVPYLLYGNGYLYLETEYDFSVHTAYLLKLSDNGGEDH